jgi:transcriptional regulator with XRE-family HTH domain
MKKQYEVYAEALREAGISKADLVRLTGMTYCRVSGFFNGYHSLREDELRKINAVLGIQAPGEPAAEDFAGPPAGQEDEGEEGGEEGEIPAGGAPDYSALRGRIREVCGSGSGFARKLGVSPATLVNRLQGKSGFRSEEIARAMHILGIPDEERGKYFFPEGEGQ